MDIATTILHVHGTTPPAVEQALSTIFASEECPRVLRLEGTFSAVLARATDSDLDAAYRYLICRPHVDSAWVPILELGNRTEGLDVALSRALGDAPVFSTFAYGDGLSGYRLVRAGTLVDRYSSDPTFFAAEDLSPRDLEEQCGHPERFADLLPAGTAPEDFARIVLRPGWWEEYDADRPVAADETAASADGAGDEDEADADLVDELDRVRCIALALELWGPTEYPFAADLDEVPNNSVGPAIALAFA
jgi:hypothetical protein